MVGNFQLQNSQCGNATAAELRDGMLSTFWRKISVNSSGNGCPLKI